MRRMLVIGGIVLCLVMGLQSVAAADANNRYVNGVEGIKGGSVPPPGLYLRVYNAFYNAGTLNDDDGDKLPVKFDVDVFAVAPRLIWVSKKKILGANYALDFMVPLIRTNVKISPAPGVSLSDDEFGLGDIWVEPLVLAWHGKRWDAAFGVGGFIPSGSDGRMASPSRDYWTAMLTLGGTVYFNEKKTLHASILSRYEFHSHSDDLGLTPGDDFHFEWGLGKTIPRKWIWDVGLAGYCQWQVTDDSKPSAQYGRKVKDQVFAVGPEVGAFIPKLKSIVSLRSLWEFGAKDRSEGNLTALTITRMF